MSRPDEGDFLGRWSARKLQARGGREPSPEPAPAAEAPPADAPAAEVASEKTDAEVLEELGLPDPDTLIKGDDFQAFLRSGVPARLRARALRRLWVSDPVLANLDGLNDYDQDFTDAATVLPGLKTAYRVGRGLLRDEEERTAAAPERAAAGPDGVAMNGAAGQDTGAGRVAEASKQVPGGGSPDMREPTGPEPMIREPTGPKPTGPKPTGAEPTGAEPRPEADAEDIVEIARRPARMRFRFDP